jgi:hypothetical protein
MEKMTDKAIELGMTFSSKFGGTQIIESFKHIIMAWQQDNGSFERHEVCEGWLSGGKESLLIVNKGFLGNKDLDNEQERTGTIQNGCRDKRKSIAVRG